MDREKFCLTKVLNVVWFDADGRGHFDKLPEGTTVAITGAGGKVSLRSFMMAGFATHSSKIFGPLCDSCEDHCTELQNRGSIGTESLMANLSERQKLILKLMADNLTEAEIAQKLRMRPKTLEFHKQLLRQKSGTQVRPQCE